MLQGLFTVLALTVINVLMMIVVLSMWASGAVHPPPPSCACAPFRHARPSCDVDLSIYQFG
ncbi:hypothetical protein ACIQF6_04435 [Kitasatospora sp. NPDC092948]|uniref:hypothetical protein n=1 Tax=Kitasatospora sp. NPDC092948 TaxID=3364088 RepID=UPI0037F1B4BF